MKPIEKPTWIENEVSYHLTGLGSGDSVASLLKKLIENQNEIIKDLDLYKRCYESHIRVHEEYREVPKEEPGHWECVDCNHVYSKTDSGAAYMPIENDGEEYNCIFCEPGGGTVHWIPDKPEPGHWECPEHGIITTGIFWDKYKVYKHHIIFEDGGPRGLCALTQWRPDKPKEDGYYWCNYIDCQKEIPKGECWSNPEGKYHTLIGTRDVHKVTGPHIDVCPECNEPMECLGKGECPGPFVWQMKCRECGISWVEKPTQAEAIHAWRKVMRK